MEKNDFDRRGGERYDRRRRGARDERVVTTTTGEAGVPISPTTSQSQPQQRLGNRTRSRRRRSFEPLERRDLLAALWRNPVDPLDVDGDRHVAPRDALLVINALVAGRSLDQAREADPSTLYPDTDGDGALSPCDALRLINFFNTTDGNPRRLREGVADAQQVDVIIGLGQSSGARLYRVQLDTFFSRPAGSTIDDELVVSLLDPIDSANSLLDGGAPSTPLFTLAGGLAAYGGSVAGWDGQILTIDLTNLQSLDAGRLRFQLLDRNGDSGSRVVVQPLSNEVNATGTSQSLYPLDENPALPDVEENDGTPATTAFTAFARWGESDVPPEGSIAASIEIDSSQFDFAWGGVILGLVTRPTIGSPLDPGFVRVLPKNGALGRTLSHKSQSIGGRDSLTLVRVGFGEFDLAWQSDKTTTGPGHLEMFLAGDVTGDFRVTESDAQAIRDRIGAMAGDASYLLDADINRDGQISLVDWQFAQLNLGASTNVRPIALTANLAPSSDPNGNGIVQVSDVAIRGQSQPGVVVATSTLRATDAVTLNEATPSVDAQGRFEFTTPLALGANVVRLTARDSFGQELSIERNVRAADAVLDWNAAALNVIRDWTTLSNDPYTNRVVPERPPVAARNLAMIHLAMDQAINAITGQRQPFRVEVTAPAGASLAAAAAAAAQRVAASLYGEPDELAVWDASLLETLATVADETAKAQGIAVGQAIADQILEWRANDGAGANISYTPGTEPGDWNRTFPDFLPPLLPQWPYVTPFLMTSGSMFRPAAPPPLNSEAYAAAVDEVYRLGRYDSAERTADQTATALFWADGGGTFTPPGHWNQIAADASLASQVSLADNARLFAALNMALADAGISSWDTKYYFQLWRPIDAIREGDTDGNPATIVDPTWLPLLKTPPFPTYTSGHSTFSGAAATVLTAFFGENYAFKSTADGHEGFTQRPLAEQQVTTRFFSNFWQAAEEAGRSRIYGGIHFQFDNDQGLAAGQAVAALVVQEFLFGE